MDQLHKTIIDNTFIWDNSYDNIEIKFDDKHFHIDVLKLVHTYIRTNYLDYDIKFFDFTRKVAIFYKENFEEFTLLLNKPSGINCNLLLDPYLPPEMINEYYTILDIIKTTNINENRIYMKCIAPCYIEEIDQYLEDNPSEYMAEKYNVLTLYKAIKLYVESIENTN